MQKMPKKLLLVPLRQGNDNWYSEIIELRNNYVIVRLRPKLDERIPYINLHL